MHGAFGVAYHLTTNHPRQVEIVMEGVMERGAE